MALPDISLAQFNRIASGSYNAGQIDFRTDENGTAELVKVNNHVWKTSQNDVILSPERVLEVKLAFLNALQKGGVSDDAWTAFQNDLNGKVNLAGIQKVYQDAYDRYMAK